MLPMTPPRAGHPARSLVPLSLAATALLSLAALSLAPPAQAANPSPNITYTFNGTLTDSSGGSTLTLLPDCPSGDPNATQCNSATSFGTDGYGPYWQWASADFRGGGFTVQTNAPTGDTYTIALKFSFSDVNGYRKIIDYQDRTSDNGFYFLSGVLMFYPGDSGSQAYPANTVLDLVAVRDASVTPATFTVYAVGPDGVLVQQFSYEDPGGYAIPQASGPGSILGFFFDDSVTGREATRTGRVYSMKVWNDVALTEQEIQDEIIGVPGDENQRPPDVLQQLPRPANGSCAGIEDTAYNWAGVPSGGWAPSWAQWAEGGSGGNVCTRSLTYNSSRNRWMLAP